jgi:hypothetical protein
MTQADMVPVPSTKSSRERNALRGGHWKECVKVAIGREIIRARGATVIAVARRRTWNG